MYILFLGNIGSGKSTIISILMSKNQHIKLFSIDNYRKRFGDGSLEVEKKIVKQFIDEIPDSNDLIFIEIMGIGNTEELLFEKMKKITKQIEIIILETDFEILIERVNLRNWSIPFPASTDKIEPLMLKFYRHFTIGKSYFKWKNLTNVNIRFLKNNVKKDIENNVKLISQLIKNGY